VLDYAASGAPRLGPDAVKPQAGAGLDSKAIFAARRDATKR